MRTPRPRLAPPPPPALDLMHDEHGDVPGWVLVTLMTAGTDFRQ